MKAIIYQVLIILLLLQISCVPEKGLDPNVNYELYVTEGKDQTPAVSPDGNWIAYYHDAMKLFEPEDYPTGLYIIDIDGGNRRLLLKGNHWSPSWSPDGKWLVFTSEGVIQIISFEGDSIRTFKGINDLPLHFPDWSDDGKLILFSSGFVVEGGGFISDPKFEFVKQIYTHYQINAYPCGWCNNNIICSMYSTEWIDREIVIVDTSTLKITRLTYNGLSDNTPKFSKSRNLVTWEQNMRIYLMNVTGGEQKYIDIGRYPTWTPDGNNIIYNNANKNITKEVIWKIDINGNNKTQITF